MNRGALPGQHLVAGGPDRLAHRRTGLARIAIHLALGVGAEVVAIHRKPLLVAHGPGAGEHRLGCQGGRGSTGPDLVGHHAEQIALQGHLLHQRPAAVGIALQPERAGKHSPLPAQAPRRLESQRTLHQQGTNGIRNRTAGPFSVVVGAEGSPIIGHFDPSGNRRCTVRKPGGLQRSTNAAQGVFDASSSALGATNPTSSRPH